MKFSPLFSRKAVYLVVVSAWITPKLWADDYSWNATGNSNWGTASNWRVSGTTPTAVPGAGDNLVGFNAAGTGALQMQGDRAVTNFIFGTSRDLSVINASAGTSVTLTIGGTLAVDALDKTLTFRNGGATNGLSVSATNVLLTSGMVSFGTSLANNQLTAFTSAGTVRINGGTMNFVLASGTASLNALVMQGGALNIYGQTSGTGALAAASLSGSGGTIQAYGTAGTTVGNLIVNGSSGTSTYGGVLANGGAGNVLNLTKSGAGTQILTGTNSYTGTTTVAGGVLQIGNGGTTGSLSSSSTIVTNATLAFNRSDAATISNAITGSGGVMQAGTGTTILTGSNAYTGTTTISAGALQVGNGGSVGSITSDVAIQNGSTLIFARTGALTYGGVISGTNGLIQKQNSGTVTLTGASTFSGSTVTTLGSVVLGNANALQNSTVSVGNTNGLQFGTGTNNYTIGALAGSGNFALQDTAAGAVVLRVGNNNAGSSYSGDLSGAGSLVKIGTGTLTLTGSNAFSGTVAVVDGALQIGQGGAAGTLTSDVNLQNNAALIFAKTGSTTYGGVISGTTGLVQKLNSGTLILTGASTFSGTTLVQNTAGNNIRLANANALQNSTVSVSVTNGLQFDSATGVYTIGGLTGGSNFALQNIASGTVTLRAGNNNRSTTYSGTMSGVGSLTKIGTGTLTLSNGNTFSGNTTVENGTLRAASANALGATTAVNVQSGGLLQISVSNAVNDSAAITLSGGKIVRDSGVSEVMGNLALTANSTIDYGTGTLGSLTFGTYTPVKLLTVSNFTRGDTLVFGSDLRSVFASDYSAYFYFGTSVFSTSWANNQFTITAVPEPSSVVAGALLLGVVCWPRRRRKAPVDEAGTGEVC